MDAACVFLIAYLTLAQLSEGAQARNSTTHHPNGGGDYKRVYITQHSLKQCFAGGGTYHVRVTSGDIYFRARSTYDDNGKEAQLCTVKLEAREGMWIGADDVSLRGSSYCDADITFTGDDTLVNRPVVIACQNDTIPTRILVPARLMLMKIFLRHNYDWNFLLRLQVVTLVERQDGFLDLGYTTATTGYLQTSPLAENKWTWLRDVRGDIQLHVPRQYVVMISAEFMHLPPSKKHGPMVITLSYMEDNVLNPFHRSYGPEFVTGPMVVHEDVVFFTYEVDGRDAHTARFRMRFTFHSTAEEPQLLPSGLWNCSVANWPDFEDHFNCDLAVACDSAQDEQECEYSSELCTPGTFYTDGFCYKYVNDTRSVWEEASDACQLEGMTLATFSTAQSWHTVFQLLHLPGTADVFVGIKSVPPTVPQVYRNALQWSTGAIAHFLKRADISGYRPLCGHVVVQDNVLKMERCDQKLWAEYICQFEPVYKNSSAPQSGTATVRLGDLNQEELRKRETLNVTYSTCHAGHMMHKFLVCDVKSACDSSCDKSVTSVSPCLTCENQLECVLFTLVCDHRSDCSDGTDEDFCVYQPCNSIFQLDCGNGQCVNEEYRCDNIRQCANGFDELECHLANTQVTVTTPLPPGLLVLLDNGRLHIQELRPPGWERLTTYSCSVTHFACPRNLYYCLPVYFRCNGMADCPSREDEEDCESFSCPGFYRCRDSRVCVHTIHLCDGVYQCPQHDDEFLCHFVCPQSCVCSGLAWFCSASFQSNYSTEVRFLNADNSGIKPEDLTDFQMLVQLILSHCGLRSLQSLSLKNLRIADFSDNHLTRVSYQSVASMPNLKELRLAANPLLGFYNSASGGDNSSLLRLPRVIHLQLSRVAMREFDAVNFDFPEMQSLNLSGAKVDHVPHSGFGRLRQLKRVDLSGCSLTTFPPQLLRVLDKLEVMYTDNFRLCCPALLPPGFNVLNCHGPSDVVSSCDALLRTDVYRVFLSVFAVLAIFGNAGSFVFRTCLQKSSGSHGFDVLVTHLCVSDLAMGVYLAFIGIADILYKGSYVWNDLSWRGSVACKVAGLLSLLSCEVSAFVVCLITLDRFLVLRFPFSQLHLTKTSAQLVCLMAWSVGLLLSSIPLLPALSHWQFYGQTGICIPLPISRQGFPGHHYSFTIIIILNFALFLMIAVGQLFIYWSICANRMTLSDTTNKSKDVTIARRLITVAVSDFLCWFPIGLLGLLSSQGFQVSRDLNVAMAIFVLPVNSALNPFLYTMNIILEKRRRAHEERLKKFYTSQLHARIKKPSSSHMSESATLTSQQVLQALKSCLAEGLLTKELVDKCVTEQSFK